MIFDIFLQVMQVTEPPIPLRRFEAHLLPSTRRNALDASLGELFQEGEFLVLLGGGYGRRDLSFLIESKLEPFEMLAIEGLVVPVASFDVCVEPSRSSKWQVSSDPTNALRRRVYRSGPFRAGKVQSFPTFDGISWFPSCRS
jgi:hypothetical protein